MDYPVQLAFSTSGAIPWSASAWSLWPGQLRRLEDSLCLVTVVGAALEVGRQPLPGHCGRGSSGGWRTASAWSLWSGQLGRMEDSLCLVTTVGAAQEVGGYYYSSGQKCLFGVLGCAMGSFILGTMTFPPSWKTLPLQA